MLRLFFFIMAGWEDTEIWKLCQRISQLDEDELFLEASDQEVLDEMENLNRRQLIQGQNSEGEMLSSIGGEYSDLTMKLAEAEGRPKSGKGIVNLHDHGDYHNSIQYDVDKSGYPITSDPIKTDPLSGASTNLLERYGPEVEGLTEENMNQIIEKKLHPKYVAAIEKKIFQ